MRACACMHEEVLPKSGPYPEGGCAFLRSLKQIIWHRSHLSGYTGYWITPLPYEGMYKKTLALGSKFIGIYTLTAAVRMISNKEVTLAFLLP